MTILEHEAPIRFTGVFADPLNPVNRNMRWAVRLVEQGDRYGKDDRLIHESSVPLIEFFDLTQPLDKSEPLGCFVSRCSLDVLQKNKGLTHGLLLENKALHWVMPKETLSSIVEWARHAHAFREKTPFFCAESQGKKAPSAMKPHYFP